MSNVKHTPGPLAVIASASGKPLIVANHPQHDGDVARMARDTPEAWATANLFAAAPELLKALQDARDVLRAAGLVHGGTFAEINAVLSKATGDTK